MTDDRQLLSAFDKGRAASAAGKPVADNPFRPSEADLYEAWREGWQWEEGPGYRGSAT